MGTNYYYHPSGERLCPHCGQETPNLHIGKSSGGWNFSLRVHPREDRPIRSLDDWVARWSEGGAIFNEYGDPVTPDNMLSTIKDRRPVGAAPLSSSVTYDFLYPPRPRATYGGPTWDLCDYEFS